MFGALRIGSVHGIPIRVHVLFLLLVGFLALSGAGPVYMALIALLAVIVVLHELGHSLVAQRFGIRVIDITLWPLGGLARLSHVPESSRVEALIAVAGPAVNFVLAALGLPLWIAVAAATGPASVATEIAWWFLWINLAMGAFNLVPAFPMDGGRILRAFLGRTRDWVRATEGAVVVGRVAAVLIGLAGIATGNWLMPVLALWLWMVGAQELAAVRARHALHSPLSMFMDFARRAQRPPPAPPAPPPPAGFDADEVARLERFRGPLRQFDRD